MSGERKCVGWTGVAGWAQDASAYMAAYRRAKSRRAAGRLTRSKLLAKRPHSGGHWPGTKLDNVGEDLGKTSGRPREDLRKTSGRPRTFSVIFWKNPEMFWSKFSKIKICEKL